MENSSVCRICETPELCRRFTVNACELVDCPSCGFVQVKARPSPEVFRELYGQADLPPNKYEDIPTLNRELERRRRLLCRFVPGPGSRILEAGCGRGEFIRYLDGRYEAWGLDISGKSIEEAKKRMPEAAGRFASGPVETQEYSRDFFDAVLLWDVLEHVWDPRAVLERLTGFLKPRGYLVLSTPDIGSLAARIFGKYWWFMTPPEHLGFLSRETLRFLAREKLNCEILFWERKGKWVNLGFLVYKLRRKFPGLVPEGAVRFFERRLTKGWAIPVPTGDIQYVVLQKKGPVS